jgi:hypothetical protein
MSAAVQLPGIRFSLRRLMLVVTVAALVAYWLRPPVVVAKIEWIGREVDPDSDFVMAVFRVTNSSPNSIWYWSRAGDDLPCCTCETQAQGRWNDITIPGCGTVTSIYELRAGQSRVCRELFFEPQDGIRFSLEMSPYESMDDAVTVKSTPVDPRRLPSIPVADDPA